MLKDKSEYLIRIVDDNEEHLRALCFALSTYGWKNIQAFQDVKDFFSNADTSTCGCVLLDYKMPELTGLEVQRQISELGITLPIIFISGHADVDVVVSAFRKGAVDFLKKPVPIDELLNTIEKAVEKNELFLLELEKKSPIVRYSYLTDMERKVIEMVGSHMTSKVIAERLGRSERTIERHRTNAQKKLGLKGADEVEMFLRDLFIERHK